MNGWRLALLAWASLWLAACGAHPQVSMAPEPGMSVEVRLDPRASANALSGRLIVVMTTDVRGSRFVTPGLGPKHATWITASEVRELAPDGIVRIPANAPSFPRAWRDVPAGTYRIQAVLDVHHSFAYDGLESGDLYSPVARVSLAAGAGLLVRLPLSERYAEAPRADTDRVKSVTFVSPLLSRFWGRPVTMRAAVVLPPHYDAASPRRYPTVYVIHAFGATYREAWRAADRGILGEPEGLLPLQRRTGEEMIVVFLDARSPYGEHAFADSANDGPWGRALTTELIPYLERRFAMDPSPSRRFLTGHSTGGWAALWLQVRYPRFFGGAWATAPDPVDFRSFVGVDLTRRPLPNMFTKANGTLRNLVRSHGRPLVTLRDFVRRDDVLGEGGSQFGSFDAVFGPRGRDGRPMPLFDHRSGVINPRVARYWEQHYDISSLLEREWPASGPALRGKLHVIVGTADTYHLNEPVALFAQRLNRLRGEADIEFVSNQTHFTLYRHGLFASMWNEMYADAQRSASRSY